MAWLRAVLVLAALGVIAATVLPFGARVSWLLDLTTHFRVQYLAAAGVLAVAFVLLRSPFWTAALVSCVAVNAFAVRDYLPASLSLARGATGVPSVGRVMTVNLSRLDYSVARLVEIVRAETPDVLVLEEFAEYWDERLRKAGVDADYPYQLKVPANGAFGIALLSRHPLDDLQQFSLEDTPAIRARVRAPFGDFTIIGLHLRSPATKDAAQRRNRQLERLAELRKSIEGPLLIAGDFNITPFSPFFADWLAATGLRDARAGRGFGFSWPAFLPIAGIPIDHCIVSQEFRVVAHRRLPAFGSDHYPVLAELTLE